MRGAAADQARVARDELAYWDGKSWFRVPTPEAVPPSSLHFALRLAAGHILLGGAAGVSLFSAVAFGAGGVTGAGLITGYGHGTLVGAAIAAALALVAVITMPQLRPTGAQRVALH